MMNINSFFDLISKNEITAIEKIIDSDFDISVLNKDGSSALHMCIANGFLSMAHLLTDGGISLNIQNKNGQTHLHYAAEYNSITLANKLLEMGEDLSIQDKYGNQPLWTAVFNDKGRGDRLDIIKLFMRYGADGKHKNNVDKSPKDIVSIAGYNNCRIL